MIFWGTFFPLISELFTGNKASLAAPWFDHYTTPLAILLVLFTGIGPLLAWRRVSWASARRVFRIPLIVAAVALVALLALHRRRPQALGARPLRLRRLRPDRARRRSSGTAPPPASGSPASAMPVALVAIVSRNRRRYGGYIIHVGIAVLLIGIAASSSFQTNRDVDLQTGPEHGHRRPQGHLRQTRSRRRQREVHLRRAAAGRTRRQESKRCARAAASSARPGSPPAAISSYFEGEATSEVGLKAGAGSDLWIAVQPDIAGDPATRQRRRQELRRMHRGGPGTPPQCKAVAALMLAARDNPALRPTALAQINKLQSLTADNIARSYARRRRRRDLQGDRQPARHLDVDRRPDRPRRRPDRDLALARAPPRRAGADRDRRAEGSQVPRDPRRRTRPRRRQALRRGLRDPRRRAAQAKRSRSSTGIEANGNGNGSDPAPDAAANGNGTREKARQS